MNIDVIDIYKAALPGPGGEPLVVELDCGVTLVVAADRIELVAQDGPREVLYCRDDEEVRRFVTAAAFISDVLYRARL